MTPGPAADAPAPAAKIAAPWKNIVLIPAPGNRDQLPLKGMCLATDMGTVEILPGGVRRVVGRLKQYVLDFKGGRDEITEARAKSAGHETREQAVAFLQEAILGGARIAIVEESDAKAGRAAEVK